MPLKEDIVLLFIKRNAQQNFRNGSTAAHTFFQNSKQKYSCPNAIPLCSKLEENSKSNKSPTKTPAYYWKRRKHREKDFFLFSFASHASASVRLDRRIRDWRRFLERAGRLEGLDLRLAFDVVAFVLLQTFLQCFYIAWRGFLHNRRYALLRFHFSAIIDR